MSDPGFFRWLDDTTNDAGFAPQPGGLLDGLPEPDTGSSLSLVMEPKDIAIIPGLPQHVYESQNQGNSASADGQPDGYVSRLDQVSLAPQGLNPSGLDLSGPAAQPTDNQSKPGEKYEQGAKAAQYFGNGIDWWNDQNKILGLHFGPEGPEMLEKYTGPVGKGLVAVENGLKAGGEIANGAPVLPTIAGAGIKTGSTLGAIKLGALGGEALGDLVPLPGAPIVGGILGGIAGGLAPDWAYRNMSNQKIGEAAGQSLYDNIVNNPYYDPRLTMP